jgi:NAD(P)-dependent dehydrogenase (short-subunit alcohol dehydrogenase family)
MSDESASNTSPVPLRLDGRVAIVTGAGGGLGASYARQLASRGAAVVVNDLGTSVDGQSSEAGGAAEAVAAGIRAAGGRAVANTSDVADRDSAREIVSAAIDNFGGLDIVVNNAGIIRRMEFAALDFESLEAVFRVNYIGVLNVISAAWPGLCERGYGRIVNSTSSAGVLGNYAATAYGSTKAAIVGLTRVLALEGAPHGIGVNAIAPRALTRMTPGKTRGSLSADQLSPDRVAPVVAYLAHQDCGFSGEVVAATGGHVARFFTGMTPGFADPQLSAESVRDNIAAVLSTDGFFIPREPADELAHLQRVFDRMTQSDQPDAGGR